MQWDSQDRRTTRRTAAAARRARAPGAEAERRVQPIARPDTSLHRRRRRRHPRPRRPGPRRRPGECTVAVLAHRKYPCGDYPSLAAILADFVASNSACAGIDRVAIASAGVVLDDEVINSNLPWRISLSEMRRELGAARAAVHQRFPSRRARRAVHGPATTRACSRPASARRHRARCWWSARARAWAPPSAFRTAAAPWCCRPRPAIPRSRRATRAKSTMLRWLQQRGATHVPTEHLVSGPGLVNLYDAHLRHRRRRAGAARACGDHARPRAAATRPRARRC